MNAFETWELRVVNDDVGGLQPRSAAVNDEFAAEHAEVEIGIVTVSGVAIGKILWVWRGVEGVRGGMRADEAGSGVDSVEEFLFAGR